uniref:Transmembrane protein 212 n=1 Tax=Callorhinchus milii TaxID=7868 RepID=A0A4W3H0Y6_CALMI
MATLSRPLGWTLLTFGILDVLLGIVSFFPVLSYKPWFAGWSDRIACPLWTGAVALAVGVLLILSNRDTTTNSLVIINVLTVAASLLQFAIAVKAALLGPYCYYSFAGGVGTAYLGYAIQYPYPYPRTLICRDPLFYEFYHLGLQVISLLISLVLSFSSLTFLIIHLLTALSSLNVRTAHT